MKQGYSVSISLAVIGLGFATYSMLEVPSAPGCWLHFYCCGLVRIEHWLVFVSLRPGHLVDAALEDVFIMDIPTN